MLFCVTGAKLRSLFYRKEISKLRQYIGCLKTRNRKLKKAVTGKKTKQLTSVHPSPLETEITARETSQPEEPEIGNWESLKPSDILCTFPWDGVINEVTITQPVSEPLPCLVQSLTGECLEEPCENVHLPS